MAWLVPLVIVSGAIGGSLVSNIFLEASRDLHDKMLERLARAPMSFFSSHPVGRILNRFSKDTAIADNVLVRQV